MWNDMRDFAESMVRTAKEKELSDLRALAVDLRAALSDSNHWCHTGHDDGSVCTLPALLARCDALGVE